MLALRNSEIQGYVKHLVEDQRWLGESGLSDKWKPCLIAAPVPRSRREHVETITA